MTNNDATTTTSIRPFTLHVPDAALSDLTDRLARTRFAEVPGDNDWAAGTPVSYLRDMVGRWQELDWRGIEATINARPGFTTEIEGQTVFFQHIRSAHAGARPLLLAHTYPGSFLEFDGLIDALTDPESHGGTAEDAFHVVIPSMPGFPLSQPLTQPADGGEWTMARVARTYDTLMRTLGYDSYGVHGSDGGAMIGRELAVLEPDGFRGAHVLQLFSFPTGAPGEFDALAPEDYAALEFAGWFQTVNGYAQMNASRPATIAAALSDSPVAQLAYNELFTNFGNGTSLVSPEQILAQVTLYWLTNASGGAVRYHHTERNAEPVVSHGPIGVTVFADDFKSIRPFAERDNTGIVSWTAQPTGGHFAALEVPEALVSEIRSFFNR